MASKATAAPKKDAAKGASFDLDIDKIVGSSRVYIVEHLVVHLSLLLLAISGIALFNSVIDNRMGDDAGTNILAGTIGVEQLAVYMAMALIALPVFGLFYTRTRKSERAYPKLITSRARRRLIYVALSVAALVLLGYAIGFVYTTLLAVINADANVTGESWLQSSLKQWFALGYLGLITFFVSRLTSGVDEGGR